MDIDSGAVLRLLRGRASPFSISSHVDAMRGRLINFVGWGARLTLSIPTTAASLLRVFVRRSLGAARAHTRWSRAAGPVRTRAVLPRRRAWHARAAATRGRGRAAWAVWPPPWLRGAPSACLPCQQPD